MDTCTYGEEPKKDPPYWKKFHECTPTAIKSLKFATEAACKAGSNSYSPETIRGDQCELNIWNLLNAPWKAEVITLCEENDTSDAC